MAIFTKKKKMLLLDSRQIAEKTKRIAIQILEQNFDEPEIYLLGVNANGFGFAEMIQAQMLPLTQQKVMLRRITMSPAHPTKHPIEIDDLDSLNGKVLVLIDDVANTGRTLFYAMKPLLDILPKKIQAAVMVDRKHKAFPIFVDYVGQTLATTFQQNIVVKIVGVASPIVEMN